MAFSKVFPVGAEMLSDNVEWFVESDCYKGVWTCLTRKEAGSFRNHKINNCGPRLNEELDSATVKGLVGKDGAVPVKLLSWMCTEKGGEDSHGDTAAGESHADAGGAACRLRAPA